MALSDFEARRLSHAQHDCLIAHIDGPRPVDHADKSLQPLAAAGLLSWCEADGHPFRRHRGRPPFTKLTEIGRDALGFILAGYADKLVAAGITLSIDSMIKEALRHAELANLAPAAAAPIAGNLVS